MSTITSTAKAREWFSLLELIMMIHNYYDTSDHIAMVDNSITVHGNLLVSMLLIPERWWLL